MYAQRQTNIQPLLNPYTVAAVTVFAGAFLALGLRLLEDRSGMTWLYLLMLVQLLPFAIAITRRHFDYLAFVLFNHFVVFSVAKYNKLTSLSRMSMLFPETILAIQELIVCTFLLSGSYLLCRAVFFPGFAERQRYRPLMISRPWLLGISLFVISLPFSYQLAPGNLLVLHFACTSAGMLLMYCAASPGNERLAAFLKFLIPIACFVYFIRTGFLSFVGQFGGFWFVTTCLKRRYRDFALIVLFTAVVSAMQTVKEDYRIYLRSAPGGYASVVDGAGYLFRLILQKYGGMEGPESETEGDDDDLVEENAAGQLLKGFDRIGDDSLERVLAMTPGRVPFWNGETYRSIPFIFIPRVLWPGKPSRDFWNKFGRAYGILGSDDFQTSVGVGYYAEAYMNFGFGGMYLCALFLGAFFALVERLSYWCMGGLFYFTFVVYLTPLLNFSSDLGSMLNSTVVLTGVLYIARGTLMRMAQRDEYSD